MSVPIIDTLQPLGKFPAVKAEHVQCGDARLDAVLNSTATKTYVDGKIPDVSGKADKTYVDTELATKASTTALNSKADTSYVNTELDKKASTAYVNTELGKKADATALAGKVDRVDGKGLSENDYSDAEREKVATANAAATTFNNMFKYVD